jgi:hypothetical protein
MRVIETKSNSILSIIIRWAFGSKGSHILFSFDSDRWVVHSNLLGVNIRLFKNFMKHVEIVDQIEYKDLSLDDEEEIFQSLLTDTSEEPYDYPGFLYFIWRGFLFKAFGTKLPKTNAWGRSNMQLCTEMIGKLPKSLTKIPDDLDLGITTPDQAMQILKEATK